MNKNKNHLTKVAIGLGSVILIALSFYFGNEINDNSKLYTTNKKLPKKERVMRRDLQNVEMTKDPVLGYVPYERMENAKRVQQRLLKSGSRSAIAGVNWTNVGPTNVGGRTRAIIFDPNDSTNKRVFAGSVSGGIWKNEDITDANSSWTPINEFMANLTITCLAVDPNNPMIFYAGTGEAYTGVTPGNGVYKTTDGGATWSVLASTTSTFKYATEIVVRNENGTSVIYVGQKEKALLSQIETGGATTYIGVSGLYRSADGGSTWSQVLPNSAQGQPNTADDIDIDANGNLWVGSGKNAYGHLGGDILTCSTGCDNPTNWTIKYDASANSNTTVERVAFDIAPSDANVIYAVGGMSGGGNQDVAYFIKSTDGGTTWSNVTIPVNWTIYNCTPSTDHFTRSQSTYDLTIAIHPTIPLQAYVGAINVMRTTDGWATNTLLSAWNVGPPPCNNELHADQHAIIFRPGSSNDMIFANDGGLYYSTDAGNGAVAKPTFHHHVKDYNVSQCYAVDIAPTAGQDEFLIGLQDNGTQDFDNASGSVTTEAVGGDGAYCHIDQLNANVQIGAYIYNDYTVTTDEWTTKTQISPTNQFGRFINPTDYDDTNKVLYGASKVDKLCRVNDVGTSNFLSGFKSVGGATLGGKKATTIRVDRNTPTTIFVGTDDGKVFKIENANAGALTSTSISTGLPASTWVSSIDVELGNSNHMLVTLSNFGVVSVWESTNGGTSWGNIEGNLPDMPIRFGVFSPENNDHIILATELGIWSTDNINGTSTDWGATNNGFANVRTDMIKYRTSDKTLAVGTHGRGLYKYTFPSSGSDKIVNISNLRLQGALPSSGTTMTTLINSLIPLTDAYGAGVTATSIPATAVDWVKVELRSGASAATATTVVATTAGFLLSDGTVKNKDAGDLTFNAVADGNYYVSITHRNHLRVITNSTIALSSTTASVVDLSTVTLYSNPSITTNTPTTTVNGAKALWGGDTNSNNKVTYNGGTNDRETILSQIGFNILAEDLTYQATDVNMNAKTTYSGGTNDRESILLILGFNGSAEKNAHHPN
ncbi:MAG: hypothetical protein V3V14_02765 [Saprospiraceae bacterium]